LKPADQNRGEPITPEEFRAATEASGYIVNENSVEADSVRDDHTHPFDVRLLVTDGEISVTVAGRVTTCRAGDTFELAGNVVHSEAIGPQGVQFLAGRRDVS